MPIAALTLVAALAAAEVDYTREVRPLLKAKCVSCHGALRQKGGLRLDTAAFALQGGDNGPVVVRGRSSESRLVHALSGSHDVPRMPVEGDTLCAEEVNLLRRWIDQGAKAPAEPTPADPRRHWAYQPPVKSPLPKVRNAAWVRNPIDAFVARNHELHGLAPAPEASKQVLLRRVYLDLIGLPPTRAELQAFLADKSSGAYEKVVDRLLASPAYGERWGRHWMDVWRYSDWAGYGQEIRESARHIWHWRDWIVESLNADKGYDWMVVEMLAGDEAAPDDPQVVRATGFLVRNWYKFNRNVWIENAVEHTSKAFLGVTMNCARCHDHMYDPISQKEHYQLRAYFEPHDVRTDRLPGELDVMKNGVPRVFDAKLDVKTHLFLRGDEKHPDTSRSLEPGLPAVLCRNSPKITAVLLPKAAVQPDSREFVASQLIMEAEREAAAARQVFEKQKPSRLAEASHRVAEAKLASLKARVAATVSANAADSSSPKLAEAAGKAERRLAVEVAEQQVLTAEIGYQNAKTAKAAKQAEANLAKARGTLHAAVVEAGQPVRGFTPLGPIYPATSTGRRLALAKWIGSTANPLAARVAVNHIWMRHFHAPLVPTVFDFGVNGKPPVDQQLLDWLAVTFAERGWRMKDLHRLIVTSATYRMQSAAPAASKNAAVDPENRWLWRANLHRLEGEAVRDSLLHVSGRLDLRRGGPELDQNAGLTTFRRSLYYRHANEKQMVFLQSFDAPSVVECYRRSESVLPQQALALANSSMALESAKVLTAALMKTEQADAAFVEAAFQTVLSRTPTADERKACGEFLRQVKYDSHAATKRQRESLVHVLLNHNDFVTVR